jgi:hypothetical protein
MAGAAQGEGLVSDAASRTAPRAAPLALHDTREPREGVRRLRPAAREVRVSWRMRTHRKSSFGNVGSLRASEEPSLAEFAAARGSKPFRKRRSPSSRLKQLRRASIVG